MPLPRHVVWMFSLAVTMLCAPVAFAQAYPHKAIRIIVPFTAGGTMDFMTRVMAQKMTEGLGQSVVIDNRPGAGSVVGVEAGSKAAADGYTLTMVANSFTINPTLVPKLPYDTLKDFMPITHAAATPHLLIVHPSLPVKSFKELVALARARPGQLAYASYGTGTSPHLAVEQLKRMAGIDLTHVPYKGGPPAYADLIGGRVMLMLANMPDVTEYIKAGKMRAIAISTPKRSALAPQYPTIAEAGFMGFESNSWYGALAPQGTSKEIVARLNAEMVRVLKLPDVRERLSSQGLEPIASTPEQFAGFINSEIAKYAKIIKTAGIRFE